MVKNECDAALDEHAARCPSSGPSASEAVYRITFEQAPVGIAHVSPDGRFLRVNAKFCAVVGYSAEELLALGFPDITHPDDLEADLFRLGQLLSGKINTYSMEKRYRRKDGEIVWAHLTVALPVGMAEQPGFLISVIEDIGARKRVEATLHARETERDELLGRLQKIAACIPGFIYQFRRRPNGDYQVPYASENLRRVYSIVAQDVAEDAAPIFATIHADDLAGVLESIEYSASHLTEWHHEFRVRTPSGPTVWVEGRSMPEKLEDGSIVWYGYQSDVTERKRSERRLRTYQQRLKSLVSQLTLAEERERQRIAADLHDYISQSLTLARVQLATAQRSATDTIQRGILDEVSDVLLEAIRDTRDLMFELSSPSMMEMGLGAAISEWMEQELANRHGLAAECFDHSGGEPRDADLRAILFRNVRELLSNVVRHARAKTVAVWLEAAADRLEITVQDDGRGFNPRRMFRLSKGGSGFGLFSIQERMTDLGGSLIVSSRPSAGGCKAILTLPLAANYR